MLDYPVAAQAAKACMELGTYKLDPNFEKMFYIDTYASDEFVFMIPRSRELHNDLITMSSFLPRNNSGKSLAVPSLELFCAFLCSDGLPIDKSPLFDRQNPFRNRDPRLGYTTVEFGTECCLCRYGIIKHPRSCACLKGMSGSFFYADVAGRCFGE